MSEVDATAVIRIERDPAIPTGYAGRLVVCPPARWFGVAAYAAPDLSEDEMEVFADWVLVRLRRLFQPDGSEPDEWTMRADGLWEALAPRASMPTLD